MRIPKSGLEKEEIFSRMREYARDDIPWKGGRTWAYIYDPGQEALEVGKEAYMMFLTENALDFTVFPSLLRFETELVAMGARHLNGDDDVVGNFTSGGTESILMAMKAARDYFRKHRPQVTGPEVILPETAHAAFYKAASYFDLKPVQVPVDPATFKADPERMRDAVTENTIAIVGSAPSYAHGVIDPIEELSKIAVEHGLWFHVDACVGGFLLPFFKRLGAQVPRFDFSVEGVTSISMDLHKYAYTPKGASLILYRNKEYRRHQIFAFASWPGYTMVNNTAQSSKSGGPMAAAWAVIHFIGEEGYLKIAQRQMDATRRLVEGIEEIPGLKLVARPDFSMFAFTSTTDQINVFHLIDLMKSKGWYIQPQLAYGSSPANVHVSVNASNVPNVEGFLDDLRECVEEAKGMQMGELVDMAQKALSSVDLDGMEDSALTGLLELAGLGGAGPLPREMAEINQVLDHMPPAFRERLLREFVNEIFRRRGDDRKQ